MRTRSPLVRSWVCILRVGAHRLVQIVKVRLDYLPSCGSHLPVTMPPLEASAATSPTRRALLEALKRDGPLDVRSLAARLQRSTMAVRLHLKDLEEKGFVEGAAAKQARGRPPLMPLAPEQSPVRPAMAVTYALVSASSSASANDILGNSPCANNGLVTQAKRPVRMILVFM